MSASVNSQLCKSLRLLNVVHHPLVVRKACVPRSADGAASNQRLLHGLFTTSHDDRKGVVLPSGSLLAMIPIGSVISPTTVRWSPFGPLLLDAIGGGDRTAPMGNNTTLTFSHLTCLVTTATALHLGDPNSPWNDYLGLVAAPAVANIDDRVIASTVINAHAIARRRRTGDVDQLRAKYFDVRRATVEILKGIIDDLHKLDRHSTKLVTLDQLIVAHRLCESRCTKIADFADEDDISDAAAGVDDEGSLGGPSLVPWVDLINHSFDEPNVTVGVVTDEADLREYYELALRTGMTNSDVFRDGKYPPAVIAIASQPLCAHEELHCCYVDRNDALVDDLLFWALRFYFDPLAEPPPTLLPVCADAVQ